MKVKKVKLNDTLLNMLFEGKNQIPYKNAYLLKFLGKKGVKKENE
jgi:hypothetical protein